MNPVYKICLVRTVQFASPVVVALLVGRWLFRRSMPSQVWYFSGAATAAALSAHLFSTFTGTLAWGYPDLFTHLNASDNAIALTFDDGPSPATTSKILDILDAQDVKATFFLLGSAAEKYPELASRIAACGHTIGCHGYSHKPMPLMSRSEAAGEIRRAYSCLPPDISRHFRPPFGFKSPSLASACRDTGVVLTSWSINPKDYKMVSAAKIVGNVVRRLHRGGIVLLHDGLGSTVEALPTLICKIRNSGYRLCGL